MIYKVTPIKAFTGPKRSRAGFDFFKGIVSEVSLDDDQVDAIKADVYLEVVGEVESAPAEPTKAELIANAEARDLTLEGLKAKSTLAQVKEAIANAEATQSARTHQQTLMWIKARRAPNRRILNALRH